MSDSGNEHQGVKQEQGATSASPARKRKTDGSASTLSPKKRAASSSGEVGTGDPEVVLFIVKELLEGCSKETRERAARQFGVDAKKLHNLWSKRMKWLHRTGRVIPRTADAQTAPRERIYKQLEQALKH